MYHMGIATVRGRLGTGSFVPFSAARSIEQAYQDYHDEPYAAYELLVAHYIADDLLDWALAVPPSSPLVGGRVNQTWIDELLSIRDGLRQVEHFVDNYVNAGGRDLYQDAYLMNKVRRELPQTVARLTDIAETIESGIRNTEAGIQARALVNDSRTIGGWVQKMMLTAAQGAKDVAKEITEGILPEVEKVTDKITLGWVIPIAAITFIAWGALKRK